MIDRERITAAVLEAIEEANGLFPPDRSLEVSPQAGLLEPPGRLDSLGLVNLIVAVESRCEARLGQAISLVDALSLSPEESPFRDVPTLVEHLQRVLSRGPTHV